MPRKPGRESTRKTVLLEDALVASFFLPWEVRWDNRPCCITHCDHRIGKCAEEIESIAPSGAHIVTEPNALRMVGQACPCCVEKILDPPF